ncbi:uncharacterized protein SCHCODRAFT_01344200 [Schizophyllum commune H4-8]|uniref:F-box domain-containing protein n=1 Tax=Schizophyllum commune (strain H4-8 / FGSC 9210) TaxID=578458 RepID=D8PTU4_SCHCM|nr:uncharacterized protein SCHCODRAFT_01344200 [Schizophyllum commune H4-8]KAI5900843.1 hypothetical protein SCHCODRAFT_01344200 [Schizophyllum commune H4-8]
MPARAKTLDEGAGSRPISPRYAAICILNALPLDVLFEVFGYVDPISLLHLSRTSKALRSTLMSRSSIWIWKRSYATTNHGLPPAPKDLTIPQFLELAVDRTCDYCHRELTEETTFYEIHDSLYIFWTARLRSCSRCHVKKRYFIAEKDMDEYEIVRAVRHYFGPEFPLPTLFLSCRINRTPSPYNSYARVKIEQLSKDFEEETNGKPVEDKKAWFLQKVAEHEVILEHAKVCKKWESAEKKKRSARKQEIRDARFEEIVKRLSNLTSPEVTEVCYATLLFARDPFVSKAKPLTDEEWVQDRDRLLEWVQKMWEDSVRSERRRILEERYLSLKKVYDEFVGSFISSGSREARGLPRIGDLVTWKEVAEVIEGTPLELELLGEDLRELIDQLAQTRRFTEWREACENALIAKLDAAAAARAQRTGTERKRPASAADLTLAATVFWWRRDKPCWYPELLARTPQLWSAANFDDPQHMVGHWAWSARLFSADLRDTTARLVTLAGLDPGTATPEDMDARDAWFTPAECATHNHKDAIAMTWRRTVMQSRLTADFVLVSDEDSALARAQRTQMGAFEGHVFIPTIWKEEEAEVAKCAMRRSLRLKNAAARRDKQGNAHDSRHSQAPATPLTPSRKRQRTRKSIVGEDRKPGRKLDMSASAAAFQQMPLDVLYETSKALHNTLLDRSSSTLWKEVYTASTGHELPPASEDLPVPQLAVLINDYTCSRAFTVLRGLPTIGKDQFSGHVVHEDALAIFKNLCDVRSLPGFPAFALVDSPHRLYTTAPIGDFVREYERDYVDRPLEDTKAWITAKAAKFEAIRKHALACEQWERNIMVKYNASREQLREDRREAILERLEELGLASEVRPARNWERFIYHSLVWSSAPLTEQGWRDIRKPLLEFVRSLRDERRSEKRRKVISDRYYMLGRVYEDYLRRKTVSLPGEARLEMTPDRWAHLGIGDLVRFPEVTARIESTPVSKTLTEANMRALINKVAQTHFDTWLTGCETALVDLLNQADPRRTPPATSADLHLAATVFSSVHQRRRFLYPEVLGHRPAMLSRKKRSVRDVRPEDVVRQRAWSAKEFKVDPTRLRLAEKVVELAGLDPRTATQADMNRRDAWYAFVGNPINRKNGRDSESMTWRDAVVCLLLLFLVVSRTDGRVSRFYSLPATMLTGRWISYCYRRRRLCWLARRVATVG